MISDYIHVKLTLAVALFIYQRNSALWYLYIWTNLRIDRNDLVRLHRDGEHFFRRGTTIKKMAWIQSARHDWYRLSYLIFQNKDDKLFIGYTHCKQMIFYVQQRDSRIQNIDDNLYLRLQKASTLRILFPFGECYWPMKIFQKKHGKGMSKDKWALQKLRREVEKAKRALSTMHQMQGWDWSSLWWYWLFLITNTRTLRRDQ